MGKKNGRNDIADLSRLNPLDSKDKKILRVVIETPKGSRNKFAFDPDQHVFELKKVLPTGMAFPYDFGFVPSTEAEDGDPIDVLVLMDEPAFTGCLVRSRLLGVIEAEQTEKGKTNRNDRLIAVACNARTDSDLKTLSDMNPQLLDEIEHFFVSYNEVKGKKFKPLGRHGPKRARRLITKARRPKKR